MKNYILINPQIQGSIDTKFKTHSALDAAKIAYETLSKYFSNNIPKFSFTLQKGGSDKLYHFDVTEKITSENKIRYNITENKNVTNLENFKKFLEDSDEKIKGGGSDEEQTGGKHHKKKHKKKYKFDDDDSSSSSDSSSSDEDYYYYYKPLNRSQPITYWAYYPSLYNLQKIYVPTFVPSVTPYIYIQNY